MKPRHKLTPDEWTELDICLVVLDEIRDKKKTDKFNVRMELRLRETVARMNKILGYKGVEN